MLRKKSTFREKRLLGIIYIVAQIIGGLLVGLLSLIVEQGGKDIAMTPNTFDSGSHKTMPSIVSEAVGAFIYTLFFIISTDKEL